MKFKHGQCIILCVYIDKTTSFKEEINVHLWTNNKTYLNNSRYVLLCVIVISWRFSRRSQFGNLGKYTEYTRHLYLTYHPGIERLSTSHNIYFRNHQEITVQVENNNNNNLCFSFIDNMQSDKIYKYLTRYKVWTWSTIYVGKTRLHTASIYKKSNRFTQA